MAYYSHSYRLTHGEKTDSTSTSDGLQPTADFPILSLRAVLVLHVPPLAIQDQQNITFASCSPILLDFAQRN